MRAIAFCALLVLVAGCESGRMTWPFAVQTIPTVTMKGTIGTELSTITPPESVAVIYRQWTDDITASFQAGVLTNVTVTHWTSESTNVNVPLDSWSGGQVNDTTFVNFQYRDLFYHLPLWYNGALWIGNGTLNSTAWPPQMGFCWAEVAQQ